MAAATETCTINGEARACDGTQTIAALLAEMALAGKKVAVEKNGAIVPKSRHGSEYIAAGDAIEIVTAVGGG